MRRRSTAWGTLMVSVIATLVLSVPPALPTVPLAGPAAPTAVPFRAAGTSLPPVGWTVNGTVLGNVGALVSGGTPSTLPVAGANVSVVDAPCPVLPDPNDDGGCQYVASATTDAHGNFTLTLPAVSASYWLYSQPADGFGGDYDFLSELGGPVGPLTLSVWPYRPYGNASIVLPGYANLSSYACNGQGSAGCGTSVQVPLLSWTADGATYVNGSDSLVFYSFPNRTLQVLSSAWTPLYQNFMDYGGVEDTEWVTADGSYVYTLGCPTLCRASSDLEFEAVNVSTGLLATHTWNATAASTYSNGQSNLIGLNGSDNVAALINETGVVHLWSLANRSEWVGGRLAFFEANNAYWVPELNSFIDVQAGGSRLDRVDQYRFNGTGLRLVYSGAWANGVASDFVNGLVYNLTAHRIYFEAGSYSLDSLVTSELTVGPSGTIVAANPIRTFADPSWPARKWAEVTPSSSEHRIVSNAWGPTVGADFSPLFDNSSWLQDPAAQTWFDTNQTMDAGSSAAGNAPQTVEGLFYNGSYAIDPASLYCAGTGNKNWSPNFCPLEGTFPGSTIGTIWWFWQIGQPEFPFPSDSPIDETLAPPAPSVRVASIGATTLTVNWTWPGGAQPLANWTVFWGTSPGNYTQSSSVVPWARSAVVGGLAPGTTYYIGVRALNLHWFGPTGVANGTPLGPPPAPLTAPTGLSIGPRAPEPLLTWTNPAGPITNTTVYWGPSCSRFTSARTVAAALTSFVAPIVPNGTAQWYAVAVWSADGRSALSNCVSDAPPPPTIVYATAENATSVEIYLSESVGSVFNVTVRYGPPSCGSFPSERATGNGGPWAYESALNASQSYCFEAASWSYGGESPWSSPVVAATFGPVPGPPDMVWAAPNPLGEVVVDWGNPSGPLVNDTVAWGPSCGTLGNATGTDGPATSFALPDLPVGTTTWVSVTAWAPSGPSVPSTCVSDAPTPPSIVSAVPEGPATIDLDVSDLGQAAVHHTIAYGPTPCGGPWRLRAAGAGSDMLALGGLAPSTSYCLEVALGTLAGESNYSHPVRATTGPSPPTAASGLAVLSVGVGSVTLGWTDPSTPITNATIEVGRDCTSPQPWENESPTATQGTVTGLSASSTYCFSIVAWNGSAPAAGSGAVTATTLGFGGAAPSPPSPPPMSGPIPPLLVLGAFVFLAVVLWVRRPHRAHPSRPRGSVPAGVRPDPRDR